MISKFYLLLIVGGMVVQSLAGAVFDITSREVTAQINTAGGTLASLKYKGQNMTCPGTAQGKPIYSFDEQAFYAKGKEVFIENFRDLDYRPIDVKKDQVTVSARGTRALDWLRITKKFQLNRHRPELIITWNLENISSQPRAVGFIHRTLLRRHPDNGMKNLIYVPREQQVEKIPHPGPLSGNFRVLKPAKAYLGIVGADDGLGALILLPRNLVTSYYAWLSGGKYFSTLEWYLREMTVVPGQKTKFEIRVRLTDKMEQEVRGQASRTVLPGTGAASQLPQKYATGDKSIIESYPETGVLRQPANFMDIRGVRQFNPSVRGALIPGSFDPEKISVYNLANNQAELDRPVPFKVEKLPSGESRVLVYVPGINPEHDYDYTKIEQGYAWDSLWPGKFTGSADFAYRICFDYPTKVKYPERLFAGGPDLIYNGSFDRPNAQGDWADGYFWSHASRKRLPYAWTKDGVNNSYCLKLGNPGKVRQWPAFPLRFRLEPQVKYTVKFKLKGRNLQQKGIYGRISFLDAQRKMDRKKTIFICSLKRNDLEWKSFSRDFFQPEENFVHGVLFFSATNSRQELFFDDVKIIPADFRYIPRSKKAELREEVKAARYPSLDYIEKISHQIVTPHTKWFTAARDRMPEIVYMPLVSREPRMISNIERRQIVEFCQRMDLKYHYVPLLIKLSKAFGYHIEYGKGLERYSLYLAGNLPKPPKLIIVQALNFDLDGSPEFVDLLAKYQRNGANFLFYNCRNIPAKLLGRQIAVPDGIFATPKFRQVSALWRNRGFRAYQNGSSRVICFTRNHDQYYIDPRPFECVPPQYVRNQCPAYYSREFPFWEYIYLSVLKSLRYLAEIEPEIKIVSNQKNGVVVQAKRAQKAFLKVRYSDLTRVVQGEKTVPVQLQAGKNVVNFDLPPLPGGEHVADYWILDEQNRVYDCGALNFETPQSMQIAVKFSNPEKFFERGKTVACQVDIAPLPTGAQLEYTVSDSTGRIVVQQRQKAAAQMPLKFTIPPPYTIIYHLDLKLLSGNQATAVKHEEFSMPGPKDHYQLDAMFCNSLIPLIKVYADLGITGSSTLVRQDSTGDGRIPAMCNLNVQPFGHGIGYINYPWAYSLKYRFDRASDPVRTPCYSDPKHWKLVDDFITKNVIQKQRYRYYGIRNFLLADEAFLGSTVCYSPHCLAAFRKSLQKTYGTLAALNREWDTKFRTWDSVVPQQLKEISNPQNLAPWLDHKIFMAGVFAHNWVGQTKKLIRKHIPDAEVGLDGTQKPGLSYDWSQLMKHIGFLAYYSGIQRKVVHDFGGPNFVGGQNGCGYIHAELINEFYEKSIIWDDMLLGANVVHANSCFSFTGDLSPVENMRFYSELLRELQKGPARLMLHAQNLPPDVGILYSQPSLFVATGGVGANIWHNSQTGSSGLLGDLKCNYRWITYEYLDKNVPNFKAVVLPAAVALSPQAVANLRKFVEKGGTVIADIAPGFYNQHGRMVRNADLESLFGISRERAKFAPQNRQLQLKSTAPFIPNFAGNVLIGETGLLPHGAQAYGRTADNSNVVLVNKFGSGRAVLLNISLGPYQEIIFGGVGGETSIEKSSSGAFCPTMRKIVGDILKQAGMRPNCQVTEVATGQNYALNSALRRDGKNYVFLIHESAINAPDGKYPMLFQEKFAKKLKVKLPVSGHLYDSRAGKYLGCGDNFQLNLIPGDGKIITILRDQVKNVAVTAPPKLRCGQVLNVTVEAVGGSGSQVFHLEMINPQGKKVREYAFNQHFNEPRGTMSFQIAYNVPSGEWQIEVRNVNTGLSARRKIFIHQ